MKIKVFSAFAKRDNSTLQPTGGTEVDVVLKTPCSILAPVFEISSAYANVNYIYVDAWSRYYSVGTPEYITNDVVRITCKVDPLASFKSDIGSYTGFVARAASQYDSMLHDDAISQDQQYIQEAEGARTTLLASVAKQGAYIIRTVGWNGINSYIATEAELVQILSYAYSQTTWANDWKQFFVDNLAAAFADPFKYIVDLRWIALTDSQISDLTGSGGRPSRRVYLGYFDTGVDLHKVDAISAYYPTTLLYSTSISIAVPAAYYNDFRDYDAGWAEYQIYIPGCGYHPLDPVSVRNGISLDFAIDILTGEIVAQVYAGTSDPNRIMLFETKGSGGCPIQIGQLSAQGSGAIVKSLGSKLNFADQALSVGVLGDSSGALPFHNAISALCGDHTSLIGSVGSRGCIQFNPDAFITKKLLKGKEFQTATLGRPLCQYKQLSTLSGFILCNKASVGIAGLEEERAAVNAYLNSGFYYE